MAFNTKTAGNDVFEGTPAADSFYGGDGNDFFNGGGGNDNLFGEAGNDTFVVPYEPNRGIAVTVSGGDGIDSVILDLSASQQTSGIRYESFSLTAFARLGIPGFQLDFAGIQRFLLTGTNLNDELRGSNGANFLQGRLGDDTYSFIPEPQPNSAAGSKIRDTGGNDRLLLKNDRAQDLPISLSSPQSGILGLKRDETALVLDLNRDGVIERSKDLAILDFFKDNGAGSGFIEQVGNLNGNDILNANRDFIAVGADLDSDRKADLVWRNRETGENIVWRLDGTTLIGSDSLVTVPDRNWVMGGTGDFNNDGETDIAWRNNATGENVVWFMDRTTIAETGSFLTITDLNWAIGGTGDFNGDGKTDLAWRNYATGENAIWLMDGTNIAQPAFIQPVPDRNWVMSGTGDFNRDNKADLVWRNDATGENAIWLMNGTQLLDGNYFTAVKDSNWRIGQTGDFNQDGNTDIAWHNGASGLNAVWLMNGTQLDQGRFIAPLQGSSWNLINSRSPLT